LIRASEQAFMRVSGYTQTEIIGRNAFLEFIEQEGHVDSFEASLMLISASVLIVGELSVWP
jgi:hypothetical protein